MVESPNGVQKLERKTTMVQCILVAIKYNPYLANFYARIKQRRGSGKTIIATARKLFRIAYDTLKKEPDTQTCFSLNFF